MSISIFLTLLSAFSVMTSLAMECVKKILNEKGIKYSSNLTVAIIACIVGIGGTACYYICTGVEFCAANIVAMILMGPAVAVASMVSYDKIKDAIIQLQVIK